MSVSVKVRINFKKSIQNYRTFPDYKLIPHQLINNAINLWGVKKWRKIIFLQSDEWLRSRKNTEKIYLWGKKLFSTFISGNTDDSYFNKNKSEYVILKLSSFRSLFNNDFLPTINSNSFILDIFNIPKNCFSVDLRINEQIIASYLRSQWTINVATLFENKFIFSLICANEFFNKYLN